MPFAMTTINTEPRRGRKPVEERQTIALLVIHARYVSRLSQEVSRMRSVGVVRKNIIQCTIVPILRFAATDKALRLYIHSLV